MKKFIRNKEDFVCEHCGENVIGDGYTNHCPICLYGKHVDINPGDRKSECGGLMETISVEGTQKRYILVQKCLKCGHIRKNKVSDRDSIDAVVKIIKKFSLQHTARGGR